MRKQTVDTFDPNNIETATPTRIDASANDADSLNVKDISDPKPTDQAGPQSSTESASQDQPAGGDDDAKAAKKRDEKATKALEKRVKELAKPENVELRVAALRHFDDWRDKVMQRIGEAVNQKDPEGDAHQQKLPSRPTTREKPATEDSRADPLQHIFPPCETPLTSLTDARRILIMHSILLLLLGLESYPAESRVLMLRLASSFGLSMDLLGQDEMSTAKGLLEVAKQQMNADDETKKKAEENSSSRKWKVGLGAVAGAVLIGVTGGLAAPLLAAGVGSMMGGLGLGATAAAGYLGALAGSAPLV